MEQSTAYLIMILSPVIPWLLKLTVSYRIRYKTPKINIDKFFKKKKTPFWNRFFYTELRKYIPLHAFIFNLILGCVLIGLIIVSIIYMILLMCGHKIMVLCIPQAMTYVTLLLIIVLLVVGVYELLDEK